MRQTAVEQLINRISQLDLSPKDMNELLIWFKEAKEMEKEQIREAFAVGKWDGKDLDIDSNKYYNQTYLGK